MVMMPAQKFAMFILSNHGTIIVDIPTCVAKSLIYLTRRDEDNVLVSL